VDAQIAAENKNLADCIAGVLTPRKSASLTVYHFDSSSDNLFFKLVQNAQINLQLNIDYYDKSVLLKDDFNSIGPTKPTVLLKPNMKVFLKQIVTLTKEGYFIDICFFTHGNEDKIYFANNEVLTSSILKSELAFSKTGHNIFPIRIVHGVHCYGHSLNPTWLALGAKVAVGAKKVNFFPNKHNGFANEWKKGDVSVDEALQKSNTESASTVMRTLILADALGRSNFDKCPFGQTVLGDNPCAKSYFDANWGIEWVNGKSGAENMDDSSFMFRPGLKTLTWDDTESLRW
jgi:hypothetical protein